MTTNKLPAEYSYAGAPSQVGQQSPGSWCPRMCRFWGLIGAVAAAFLLASHSAGASGPKFSHVVIIFQENRTPDNLFGSNPTFEPGVDIAAAGQDSTGNTVPFTSVPLTSCYDLGHSHADWIAMYNGGAMNGADHVAVRPHRGCKAPPHPQFKFLDNSSGTIQPYFDIALSYGFANRMFQTNQGPSFPAHQFIFGGTSAPSTSSPLFASSNLTTGNQMTDAGCAAPVTSRVGLIDQTGSEATHHPVYPCFNHPTLGDLLDRAGISWTYYAPTPGSIWTAPNAIRHTCQPQAVGGQNQCTGPKWTGNVVLNPSRVLGDIAACKLGGVSWVIPSAAQSDHAGENDGTGPQWVASIVNAIGNNAPCGSGERYWDDTAILITWDDWGGWYDHVAPFQIGQPNGWCTGYCYGFRVPLLVVSAFTPAGYVDNNNLDFGSLLRFIEQNFGLGLIGPGFYADTYSDRPLKGFFTRSTPRPFAPIATRLDASHFLSLKQKLEGPDDD